MSQEEIHQVEMSIAEAKKIVERGQAAERLSRNADFRKIVMDGYFVDEAARLALLTSDPMLDEKQRAMVYTDLNGPGAFKRYLSTIVQMGRMAEAEIQSNSETLDELRAEEEGN